MEVLKTDLIGEMRSRHDMFVLCISMDANLELATSVAALSEVNDKSILAV